MLALWFALLLSALAEAKFRGVLKQLHEGTVTPKDVFLRHRPHGKNGRSGVLGDDTHISITATVVDGQAALDELTALGLVKGATLAHRVSGRFPRAHLEKLLGSSGNILYVQADVVKQRAGGVLAQAVQASFDDVVLSKLFSNGGSLDGSGITLGILSDSFNCQNGAVTDIETGDLPNNIEILLEGNCVFSGTDEGRGMAQVAFDVAPGLAGIQFCSASDGFVQFALCIDALRAAGSQVIVDDVGYFQEAVYQDDIIAQATDRAAANGVPYFTAAGNDERSAYDAPFRPVATTVPQIGSGIFHDFSGNGDVLQRIDLPAPTFLTLHWNQPSFSISGPPGAASNFNLVVLLPNGSVFDAQNPFYKSYYNDEFVGDPVIGISINSTNSPFVQVALQLLSGPNPDVIKLIASADDGNCKFQFPTFTATAVGHSNSAGAMSVGAVPWFLTTPWQVNPPEPDAGALLEDLGDFCAPNQNFGCYGNVPLPVIEWFSSAGGQQIFFDTLGNPLPNGPLVRQKPDISCIDGSQTTFFETGWPGTNNSFFFGTSCAAPTAAAIAAIMLQAQPNMPVPTVYQLLRSTAIDMDDPFTPQFDTGFDFGTGFGQCNAFQAVQAAQQAGTSTVSAANGDALNVCVARGGLYPLPCTLDNSIAIEKRDLVFANSVPATTISVALSLIWHKTSASRCAPRIAVLANDEVLFEYGDASDELRGVLSTNVVVVVPDGATTFTTKIKTRGCVHDAELHIAHLNVDYTARGATTTVIERASN